MMMAEFRIFLVVRNWQNVIGTFSQISKRSEGTTRIRDLFDNAITCRIFKKTVVIKIKDNCLNLLEETL